MAGLLRGEWISPLSRDHSLVGSIYDVAGRRSVSASELAAVLAAADIVLLGEQHDNVDHHRLQAGLLEDMIAAGRRPAVAFEQLDLEKQATVDRVVAESEDGATMTERASALAEAVEWNKSGWPPFDDYRPVFGTALRAGLPIRAANLSRSAMQHVFANKAVAPVHMNARGRVAGGPDAVELGAEARASLAADIEESHCGYASQKMIASMIVAQRRRDQVMATVVEDASEPPGDGGVVLVAGFGHARKDYGVPVYLEDQVPGRRRVSLALLEVLPDRTAPVDYASSLHAAELPFDYVIFTPRADDEDPCEKFRAGLEKMKAR